MTILNKIVDWLKKVVNRFERRGEGISIIIPFRKLKVDDQRTENLRWLVDYWTTQLPYAEVIIGNDPNIDKPFSKSVAINDGVSYSTGDILVLVDADGYVDADSVIHCAEEIRKERIRGRRLWFVPYRKFCRLTEAASKLLLESDPANPYMFSFPPDPEHLQGDADPNVGHWYGAMIQIVPREAFDLVGGWDCRFRGWGGEDHAAMRATDTLYWPHQTLQDQVLHIWHPQMGPSGTNAWVHWNERMWEGQKDPAANNRLSWRYYHATGNFKLMRKLVDEGLLACEEKHHHRRRHHKHHHRKSC
jgi:glycosyltransferase involved in cell wall biosynthesis